MIFRLSMDVKSTPLVGGPEELWRLPADKKAWRYVPSEDAPLKQVSGSAKVARFKVELANKIKAHKQAVKAARQALLKQWLV
jgi:hypothetical protein